MQYLSTLTATARKTAAVTLFLILSLILAAQAPRAAEIEARVGYYGTLASGNLFKDGDTLETIYGMSGLRIIVTDNLSGHRFQSNGTGTCPGTGNAFCFDIVIRGSDGREIDRVRNATSDWQIKTGNVTDGFAVVDPINPSMGFFLIIPNRTNPVSGTAGTYTVRGSSDPFEADDANSVVVFLDPAATITAPGQSTGANSSASSIAENGTGVGTFSASKTVSWSLSGTDAALFTISAGGALSFLQAPDFENPRDANRDNSHELTVSAKDEAGNITTHSVTVTVTNVQEGRISGTVTDRTGAGVASAQVRLLQGGGVIATTTSDAAGGYAFGGLASGTYSIEFLPRAGKAVKARNQRGRMNGRYTEGIVIASEQAVANADAIVVDPAGVVYDARTRLPMANVQIALYRDGTLVPDSQLDTVAGGRNPQATSATGDYSFILNGSATSGTYRLVVTPPSGYGFESALVPPTAASYTPALGGGIEEIQTQATAPQTGDDTEYYTAFAFTITTDPATTSNGVVNNHIPLDPPPPAPATLDLTATPVTVVADGLSTSALTVRLTDQYGNPFSGSAAQLTLTTSAGSIGPVTDNGDGTYSATLTSATAAGGATVTASLASPSLQDSATVTFVAGPASTATSELTAAAPSLTADGTATTRITLRLKDAQGNPLTTGGATVTLSTTEGTLGPVTDNGDGTYSATLTAGTRTGTATITATLGGAAVTDTADVTLTAGAADPATSALSASPQALTADGSATATVTLRLTDAQGNPLTTGGATVTMATDAGTIGPVTDNGDGTYTAVLTAATRAGTATLTATVDGAPVTATATVAFVAGAADLATSTMTASPVLIVADGTSTSTITVRLKDAQGNDLTASGGTLTLATGMGTLGPVTDNGDGTYSATLTSSTQPGTALVTAKLDGRDLTATASVAFQDRSAPSLTGPDGASGTVTDQPFAISVPEGTAPVTTITPSEPIMTWSLGGPDAALLTISASGQIAFAVTTDYENPADADRDGIYEVEVEAFDLSGNRTAQRLTITVTDLSLPGQPDPGLGDRDGDGVDDGVESAVADRDGDSIPDNQDYDPQGYFYCAADGRILTGGRVSVQGPGNVTMVKDGSATGEYQWFVDQPGTYVMTIDTTGMAFPTLAEPSAGTYVLATGTTDPIILGATEDGSTGLLGDFNGAAHDPDNLTAFYTTFVIAEGDAYVFGNNIPFTGCADNTVTVAATANGREPDGAGGADVVFTVTLDRASGVDSVVDYTLAGTATEGADYPVLPGSLTIPAGQTTATLTAPVTEDDEEEGAETVQLTLTALHGDAAITLSGSPVATALISDDAVDEVASAVKSVLEADLGQTMARQSRQFSALAKGALGRLQDPAATQTCGTVRAFDMDGHADSGATGLDAQGTFGDEVFDCATGLRRLSFGDFALTDSDGLGMQGMLTFGVAREHQRPDRITGRFWGGYLSQSRVQADGTTGDILGAGINAGLYGARRLGAGLYLDWYGAAGAGYHRYDLRVADTHDARGGYGYAALYAGVALSGTHDFGTVTVTPRAGIDFGQSIVGDSRVTVTGPAGRDDGIIHLDPVRGLRAYLEATFAHDNARDGSQPAIFRSFELTPLLFCEDGFGLRAADCGVGLGLDLQSRDSGAGTDWDMGLDVETTGQTRRLTLRIERRQAVLDGRGTVTTGVQAADGGSPVLHHGVDLRW